MSVFQGFIVQARQYDSPSLVLEYYVRTSEGVHLLKFSQQKIPLFILRKAKLPARFESLRKSLPLQSFSQEEVDVLYFDSIKSFQEALQYCDQNGVKHFESDVPMTERFLMERFIKGDIEYQGESTTSAAYKIFESPQVRPLTTQRPIAFKTMSIDIETGVDGSLYSIACHTGHRGEEQSLVLMRDEAGSYQDDSLTHFFTTESQLLTRFIEYFQLIDPDIILGWHVIGFDLMFLERRCQKFGLGLNLGRDGSAIQLIERKGIGYFANCTGRIVLDGPPTLRACFYKFKNFKLETVASEVLGRGKDIASDENKVDEIESRFKNDKMALAKYNILDSELVTSLFQKLAILELYAARVRICGLLMDRLNVSTAAFDFLYLPFLHRQGFVAPNRLDIERDDSAKGGMVIEPTGGLHQNVYVFDFKSLYPSIMMTFQICPLGKVFEDTDPIHTPEGYQYSRTKTILPEIIKNLMQKREEAKRDKNVYLSQAIKILMNSFYGILGSSRCRFYHSDHPRAITTTGHYILTESKKFLEAHQLKVIYGDTDSLFIKGDIPDPESLAREVNNHLTKRLKDQFSVLSELVFEFEEMFSKIYFSQARSGEGVAKKRYCGLKNGELVFTGMEAVRSDWTELAKNFQRQLYQKFFDGVELEEYIKEFIKSLEAGFYDDSLTYTKKLSKDISEYKKNIPPHVQAAAKINYQGHYRLKEVNYVMTKNGPEPVENNPRRFDYQHYIEKQIKPIADDLLKPLNKSFDGLIQGDQLSLF
ncbi:MAG: hypothetical protein CME62_07230 [Halobacteriovoraceae bacterium]|nr:hypothetical protein [Halobacteriovoraceae bacterium]|tara:strand:+ start:15527 stop:17809 length:2283 start_codon:yes stop_codon:yes gene_type:complete